ncbi:MAG: toprim domain-containing protein, partial [bacterium]|nr:toprim domain-containing protein [bacterium]
FYIIKMDNIKFNEFLEIIKNARSEFTVCELCKVLATSSCIYCSGDREKKICIVEKESVIEKMENSGYRGRYFLIDIFENNYIENINNFDIKKLKKRIVEEKIEEVIFAFSYTPESKVLEDFICEGLKSMDVKISRIAVGIPFGAEIEYIDEKTLEEAFKNRKRLGF